MRVSATTVLAFAVTLITAISALPAETPHSMLDNMPPLDLNATANCPWYAHCGSRSLWWVDHNTAIFDVCKAVHCQLGGPDSPANITGIGPSSSAKVSLGNQCGGVSTPVGMSMCLRMFVALENACESIDKTPKDANMKHVLWSTATCDRSTIGINLKDAPNWV